MENQDKRVTKSLRYSILDGSFYSMMVGLGESFFSAFAVFLNANNIQLGLVGSLPQAMGSLSQLFSKKMIHLFKSRKKLVCLFSFIQGLMYIPIIIVLFLGEYKNYYLILFSILYWIFGAVVNPAWNSWMGDLVNENRRGKYFGKRNKITGLFTMISYISGGFILQQFSDSKEEEIYGFILIFSLALLSRLISFAFLSLKYEPDYDEEMSKSDSFLHFLSQSNKNNFGKFTLYLCLINFAVYISAPFFTPYMLKDLKLSYYSYIIVIAVAMLVKYLMMPLWGALSDRYGTKKILTITGYLMPMSPILWLFSGNFYYLILIQIYSGIVWSGFELSTFNFIFDATNPSTRAGAVANYNVFNGLMVITGALIGGILVRYNIIFEQKFFFLFLISGLIRYIASFIFIPKIKENRQVEIITYRQLLFKAMSTLPNLGIINQIFAHKKRGI